MEKICVSVVIPLFNKEKSIAAAIESVLLQTEKADEIVVVDDGSTDRSLAEARRFQNQKVKVLHQKNGGVSSARNFGIARSRGEFVAFLDADDEYKPQFLATLRRLIRKYPTAGAFATAYTIQKTRSSFVPRYRAVPPAPWEGLLPNYFESMLGFPPVCSSAVAIPRKVFDRVGTFPMGVNHGEDTDQWLRIALKYPIAFSNTVGSIYHWDGENRASGLEEVLDHYAVMETLVKALDRGLIRGKNAEWASEYLHLHQIRLARNALMTGDNDMALRFLRGIRTKEFAWRKRLLELAARLPFNSYKFYAKWVS